MIRIKNFLFNEDDIKYVEELIYYRATTPNEYGLEVHLKEEPTIRIKFKNEIECNNVFERISNNNVELLQNDLDNANSKVSELSNRILEAIEYINKNMYKEENGCGLWWYQLGDYETPDKLLEILKGNENNENN